MTAAISDVVSRISQARQALGATFYRTPLEPSPWLSEISDARIALKLECYQPTGSFKVRGALAAVLAAHAHRAARHIVTASAGNHGLGVAYAAARVGMPATIVVPEDANPSKVAALRRFPVTIQTAGAGYDAAEQHAIQFARETGALFISAYNNLDVIAGQGTIGPEQLEDQPELDVLLAPVGGGGLISGVGAYLKTARPGVRVIGVQSEAQPAMQRALKAGRLIQIDMVPSLADGLAGNIEPGSLTLDLVPQLVDDIILVTESEIARAVKEAFQEMHLALEGSAVTGIAALLARRIPGLNGKRVAVLVTGRNIDRNQLLQLLR